LAGDLLPRKKSKYKKKYIEVWKCKGCDFEWSYKTMKCPICSSLETIKII
jgi:rubrerythrin